MAKGNSAGTGTAVAPTQPAKPPANTAKVVGTMMEASADRLAHVLPRHMTPGKLMQVVTTLVYRTPKLQQCPPATILAAVMQAAELGLDLSPAMGEAYLIPRWNKASGGLECQFQPGYQGLVKLARQSGSVAYIQARVVHEADSFGYRYTPDLAFEHTPYIGGDPGQITHVYCMAKLSSGDFMVEVMTRDEVEGIRRRSESAERGPWVSDWAEMARKTVLKRLCKRLPRSVELASAIDSDNEEYRTDDYEVRAQVSPVGPRVSRSAALAASLMPPAEEPEFREGTGGVIATEAEEGPIDEPGAEG